ncbi:MAG: hypothetical protein GOVbin2833_42 [Prokaryotic dsDNA virus sp.]|nr:MAG: hypothetical protein GOVbin2833_42 [Prokaryotic dsDNA virus sp.]
MPSPFQTRQIARQVGGPTYNPTNITAAKVLTSSDDNQIFNITHGSGGWTITLPLMSTITAGWNVTFNQQVAGSNAVQIHSNATDDGKMHGVILDINATAAIIDEDQINLLAGSLVGDRVYCEYDGVNWYVYAQSSSNGGITATT